MRVLCLSVTLLFACTFVQAQSASPPSQQVTQDPQAVSILTQALNSAGGSTAYRAISDYTATGNIAYHSGEQGTVTVRGFSGEDVRIDASLPTGTRSWAVYQGVVSTKAEDGAVTAMQQASSVPSSDAFPYQTPWFPGSLFFPLRQLGTVLGNPASFTISDKGVTQIDGHSVHDIQFQRGTSTPTASTLVRSRELFIDTSTFQIVMMRETLPKGVLHEVHYSGYQITNGVLMPLAIAEDMGGQPTWSIQLSQVSFNTGLQESSLAIQ